MSRVSADPGGTPTEEMADYYAAFARGGFGLVITEGVYTDTAYSLGYLNQPGIVAPSHEKGWRRVAEAVRAAGAEPVMQLMHAGALSQGSRHATGTAGPSAVRPLGEKLGPAAWTMGRSDRHYLRRR